MVTNTTSPSETAVNHLIGAEAADQEWLPAPAAALQLASPPRSADNLGAAWRRKRAAPVGRLVPRPAFDAWRPRGAPFPAPATKNEPGCAIEAHEAPNAQSSPR
jgi:hypothetical protein